MWSFVIDGAAAWSGSFALESVAQFLERQQPFLTWLSEQAEIIRSNPGIDVIAFVGFGLFTIRKSISAIPRFTELVLQKYPLRAYRKLGISDPDIAAVKEVILFYLLYLSYQVVQLPLTYGSTSAISFGADLVFQVLLTTHTLLLFRKARFQIIGQWDHDRQKQEKVREWLDARLDDLNLRYDELRGNVLKVFFVSFFPAFLTLLPAISSMLANALSLAATSLR